MVNETHVFQLLFGDLRSIVFFLNFYQEFDLNEVLDNLEKKRQKQINKSELYYSCLNLSVRQMS